MIGAVIEGTLARIVVELPDLAKEINEATNSAEQHARSAVAHALKAGSLLLQAKALVPHGDWRQWIETNCTIAPRTASAYMRLAKRLPELSEADRQRVADLPLRDAVRAIGMVGDQPQQQSRVHLKSTSDASRINSALRSAASSLRRAELDVLSRRGVRVERIEKLRRQLHAALAALDELQQGAAR